MNTDEQLLKIKKQMEQEIQQKEQSENLEKELQQSIFDGTVEIFGKEVQFERREVPEFGISILMPNDYELLDDTMRKFVYPNENGPQHVFTSDEGYMNISFKQNSNIIENEQIKEFVGVSRKLLEIAGPKVKVVKTHEFEQDEMQIGVMEYISNALDGVAYNYIGMVPLNTGVLLVCITFKNNQKKRLCPIAREILQSVTILREEDVNECNV